MKKVKKEGEVRFTVELSEKEVQYLRVLLGGTSQNELNRLLKFNAISLNDDDGVTVYSLYADFCRMLNEE